MEETKEQYCVCIFISTQKNIMGVEVAILAQTSHYVFKTGEKLIQLENRAERYGQN